MRIRQALLLVLLTAPAAAGGTGRVVRVDNDQALRRALNAAAPGTRIQIAAGTYSGGVWAAKLRGTEAAPIVIEAARDAAPPRFVGGKVGWTLSDCAHVTLRNIAIRGARFNGVNVDDGGDYDTPAHHIVLEGLEVADIGPKGNYDGIKMSGVDDFSVTNCVVEGWGGQAVDMVGCHRGVVADCQFRGKDGFSQHTGPQTKGGSSNVTIRSCLFVDAGARAVNIGGSTGLPYFRPPGARYEAKDIVVEHCVFIGSQAPLAFVGVDGAVVRYNTLYHPRKWVLRILQETTAPGFATCRNGRFERNVIVYRRADVNVFVNVGPNTAPDTFRFADNLWYCEDRPSASQPSLPTPESGGVYGVDPQFENPARQLLRALNPAASGYGAWARASDGQ